MPHARFGALSGLGLIVGLLLGLTLAGLAGWLAAAAQAVFGLPWPPEGLDAGAVARVLAGLVLMPLLALAGWLTGRRRERG